MNKLENTSPTLLNILRKAGNEYGPLGVALVAAYLSDPKIVIDCLTRELNGEENFEGTPEGFDI